MPKRIYNKELVSTLLVSDLPDILDDIAEENDVPYSSIKMHSDGSGRVEDGADGIIFEFDNLEEFRKYLLTNKLSTKNL